MKIRHRFAAISLSMLLALGTGCDQEAVVEEGGEAPGITGELESDSLVEPVAGPDPGFGAAGGGIGDADLAQRGEYSAWDANADGMIDEKEFMTGFNDGDWYGDWDANDDGMLSEGEFTAANTAWGDAPAGMDTNGMFEVWDADDDGLIDNNEAALGAFNTWDRDDNNVLAANEFNEGINWFGS